MPKPAKVHKVMSEFKAGALHSGSKKGPKVTSRKQAVAIALSEAGLSQDDKGSSFGARHMPRRVTAPPSLKARRDRAHGKG